MLLFSTSSLAALLVAGGLVEAALVPYNGRAPELPEGRKPFGFGAAATGGAANPSAVYLAENMVDLRDALQLDTPRTVYVRGNINGAVRFNNVTNRNEVTDCNTYIEEAAPRLNFTQYMMSLNATYMASLSALAPTSLVEGQPVTEFIALLNEQPVTLASRAQRRIVNINVRGHLTLIGLDSNAFINGAQILWTNMNNVIVRNIRFASPRDCFPEPESVSAWNAQYDAMTLVNSTNFWVDGNVFVDGPSTVPREALGLWGWFVDRYDGLFDARLGSDNISFSHNIVGNHHKSMLFGGSRANEAVDTGKMRFTLFGNSIISSESRSPLMRHGTFYLVNNMYTQTSTRGPLYDKNSPESPRTPAVANPNPTPQPYVPNWQYNIGIDNFADVLVSGNVYAQSGVTPDDETRIFSFSQVMNAAKPAHVCIPASQPASAIGSLADLATPVSILNGVDIDLQNVARSRYTYHVSRNDVVAGGLKLDCENFAAQEMPRTFESANEVLEYIKNEAGQVGKHEP